MTPTNVLPAASVRANSAWRPLQSLCVPSSVSQRPVVAAPLREVLLDGARRIGDPAIPASQSVLRPPVVERDVRHGHEARAAQGGSRRARGSSRSRRCTRRPSGTARSVRPHRCQVSDWFTSSSITPSQGAERRSARTFASQACWYDASPTSICHAPWKSQNSILAPVVSARNQSGRRVRRAVADPGRELRVVTPPWHASRRWPPRPCRRDLRPRLRS